MKAKYFNKLRAYSYLVLFSILLLSILAFYLSCKSKSPTEANAPLSENLTGKGANRTAQTTTSSSTTTTVKPGSHRTITTTLITSRNLTTTSTSTTSTSTTTTIPGATTSIKLPPDVQFCDIIGVYEWLYGTAYNATPVLPGNIVIKNGDTVNVPHGTCLRVKIFVKNVGGSPAYHVKIIPVFKFPTQYLDRGASMSYTIPEMSVLLNDGVCRKHPHYLVFCYGGIADISAANNHISCIKIILKLKWDGATYTPKFHFTVCLGGVYYVVP